MAITGQKILDVLKKRAWAGVNKDDMVWGNEEAETIIEEIYDRPSWLSQNGNGDDGQ